MTLVDTSVWVSHLRAANAQLPDLLNADNVLIHPFIIGEVALGSFKQRDIVLDMLVNLPKAQVAADSEVLSFIERHKLFGRGIGYVDAHLRAATRLTAEAAIWTLDRKLRRVAVDLGVAAKGGSGP